MYHKVVKNNVENRFGSQGTNWSLRFSNSGIIAFRLYPFPIGRFSDNVCSLSCEITAVYFAFLNDFLALFFRSQIIDQLTLTFRQVELNTFSVNSNSVN